MDRRTRREYLALGGSAVVAGLAGCDSSGTTTDSGGEPTETTRSETTTKTENPEDLREVTVDEDWRYPRANAQNNGATSNGGPTGKLEKRWETSLDGAIYTGVNPTLANGRLFVGTKKGVAYALDAATGTEIWSNKVGNGILHPGPVVDGSVYFNAGPFISVNAETGEKEWQYSMNVQHVGTPLPVEGHVYCMGATGEVHVLDAGSGKRLWKHPLGSVQDFLAYKDGVLFASLPKKIIAIDTDSAENLWSTDVPGETNSGPALEGSNAFIEGDYIYKLSTANGSKKKLRNLQNPVVISVSSNHILFPSFSSENGHRVQSYQRGSGKKSTVKFRDGALSIISNGYAYITLNGGGLKVYSIDGLELQGEFGRMRNNYSLPITASNLSFVVDRGRLACIQTKL